MIKKKGGFFKAFFNNVTPYLDTEKRCIETGHIKNTGHNQREAELARKLTKKFFLFPAKSFKKGHVG